MPAAPDPARHLALMLGTIAGDALGQNAPALTQEGLEQPTITQVDRSNLGLTKPADFFPGRATVAPRISTAPTGLVRSAPARTATVRHMHLLP